MDPDKQKNIIVCSVCGGWGVFPLFSVQKCEKCNGAGVERLDNGIKLYVHLPSFVDYKRRGDAKRGKAVIITAAIILFLALVALLVVLYKHEQ